MTFVAKKINLITLVLCSLFFVCYVMFLSLSNSLDFNIEKVSAKRSELAEEYEKYLTVVATAQNKEFLAEAANNLGLIETTFANGYIDIRSKSVSIGEVIVRSQ